MKNIVVCVNIDQKSFESLKRVEEYVQLSSANITLVHIWNKKAYDYPGDMIVAFYPNEDQAKDIAKEMDKQLNEQFSKFSGLPQEKFRTHVLSTSDAKDDVVELLKKEKADLVICLTPEKSVVKNFFHSSFTNYLSAHAPCDVLALRI
jgi:nucleotide-binding universal stress UspA family protein